MIAWRKVKLSECCEIVSGATPRRDNPEYWGGDIAWVTPKDLSKLNSAFLNDTPERITGKGLSSCSAKILPKGAILFSSRAPIGLIAITGREMATNQGFKSLIPGEGVHSEYLYWCLKHITPSIVAQGRGATFKEVSKEIMSNVEIPLPPREEQKRIAAILDKADAIRKKRKQAIELAEQFLRSAFLDMFGDPITNPKDWPEETIGDLFSSGKLLIHKDGNYGGMYPRAEEFGETGIPFLTAKCVDKNGMLIHPNVAFLNEDKANSFTYGWIETGDVLLAHNATVGRVALYNGNYSKALIGTSLTCFRPSSDVFDPYFLFAMLRSDYFQRQLEKSMSQSTRNQVPITAQREMKLFIPPLALQQKFGCVLKRAYRNHQRLVNSEAQKKILYNSLAIRAFRGEL